MQGYMTNATSMMQTNQNPTNMTGMQQNFMTAQQQPQQS
jgi:hypothetical protein